MGRLQELESAIKQSQSLLEEAKTVKEIKDSQLYLETRLSWKDYCKEHLNRTYKSAYSMIEFVKTYENLCNAFAAEDLPTSESHTRPLNSLPPDEQIEVWKAVLETCSSPSQERVTAIIKGLYGTRLSRKQAHEVKDKGRPPEGEVAMKYARMAVSDLEKMYPHHHDRQEALDFVQRWIEQNR